MTRTLLVTVVLGALAGLPLPLNAQTLAEASAEAARRRAIAKSSEIGKSADPTSGAETGEPEKPASSSATSADAKTLDGAATEAARVTNWSKQSDRSLKTSEIAATAGSAVVTIIALDSTGREIGQGSGFLVRGDGVIVTNWHVLAGASAASVTLKSGASFDRVMFLSGDQTTDVALIKVQGVDMPTVQMTASLPEVGAKIVALGSPLGFSNTVSEGIVSATREVDGQQMVQVTAPISPGSSGGAILDELGRVFAISTGSVKAGQQINFGIPVGYVITLLGSSLTERALGDVFTLDSPATAASSRSLASIRQKADQGDADAQYSLAQAYYRGSGVAQDYTQAATWFRKAADQGYTAAQAALGMAYDFGLGVPEDYKQAVTWFRKAADQGDAAAQHLLGLAYGLGQGVKQDDKQAVAWYRKAADQGYADSQFLLGSLYARGQGVPQDNAQALVWYGKAADQGNVDAQSRLGGIYLTGRGVSKDETQAVAWFRKAAEQGNVDAQYFLCLAYAGGRGVPQDYVESHKWGNLAASRATGDNRVKYAKTREVLANSMTPAQLAEAQKRAADWQAAFEKRQPKSAVDTLGISSAPVR